MTKYPGYLAASALVAFKKIVTFNGAGEVLSLFVTYVSNATAGNRQLELRLRDAAGNLRLAMPAGAVQAASLTRTYTFMEGPPNREAAFVAGNLLIPLPEAIIPSGGTLELCDTASIDTADTVALAYTFREYP